MKLTFPLVPIEIEITARRRTEPFRFRVRTLLIIVAVVAVIMYLLRPFSAHDQRLMALYEKIGNHPDPENALTRAEVIRLIGPPTSVAFPANQSAECSWVAHFDSPMNHQQFELNLSYDPSDDMVVAQGLYKTEYQGLDLLLYRLDRLLTRIRF